MNRSDLVTQTKHSLSSCADLATMAEKELAAFFKAVTQMFGAEQAELAAEDWLHELSKTDELPNSTRGWSSFTAKVSVRLAARVNALKLSAQPQAA